MTVSLVSGPHSRAISAESFLMRKTKPHTVYSSGYCILRCHEKSARWLKWATMELQLFTSALRGSIRKEDKYAAPPVQQRTGKQRLWWTKDQTMLTEADEKLHKRNLSDSQKNHCLKSCMENKKLPISPEEHNALGKHSIHSPLPLKSWHAHIHFLRKKMNEDSLGGNSALS